MTRKHSRSLLLLTFLALALVALAACGGADPTPTPSAAEVAATVEVAADEVADAAQLKVSAWDLEYFGPAEQPYPMLPDTRATIAYFLDRYAGFDGCNWFLGVYETDGDGTLRNYTPSETINTCAQELNDQSALFATSLLNVTNFAIADGKLIESTVEDQRLLTFNPAEVIPVPGTTWQLKFWWSEGAEEIAPAVPESNTFIVFGEDGTATGNGGCNDFSVAYTGDLQFVVAMQSGDTEAELPALTFGDVTYNPTTCDSPENIMQQEQGFLAQLGEVAYYFRLGGMLLLLDAEQAPIMMMGAQD